MTGFGARRPAAVVLDVTMPGLDGWQVLERIREVSDVPVLMLTVQDEELHRVRGLMRHPEGHRILQRRPSRARSAL